MSPCSGIEPDELHVWLDFGSMWVDRSVGTLSEHQHAELQPQVDWNAKEVDAHMLLVVVALDTNAASPTALGARPERTSAYLQQHGLRDTRTGRSARSFAFLVFPQMSHDAENEHMSMPPD